MGKVPPQGFSKDRIGPTATYFTIYEGLRRESILSLIYPLAGWYFYRKENRTMILKIVIGLGIGAAAGFGLSYLSRGIGSS